MGKYWSNVINFSYHTVVFKINIMWIPHKIVLNNFKSFVEQEFVFEKGAFLIQGINKTDESQASNGSGKSTLRESLCYVLDLPLYASTLTDLINNDAKECKVELTLKNKVDTLKIIKSTPLKGSGTLFIELNGEDQKDKFATTPEGHKYIIELLGVSKEDLINHYIISKEKYKSFFSSSDKEVKELIGRFSNFNRIDGVEDYVEADVITLNSKLQVLNSEYNRLLGKIDILKEQLEQEQNLDVKLVKSAMIEDFESAIVKHQENISDSNSVADNIRDSIKVLNQELVTEKAVLSTLEEQITKLKVINFDKELTTLEEKKKAFKEQEKKVNEVVKDLSVQLKEFNVFKIEVETAIEGSIKCPKCLHEFLPNGEMDIEEAKLTLPQVLESLNDLNNSLNEQEDKINNLNTSIDMININIGGYEIKIDEFNNHKRELNQAKINQEDSITSIVRKIDKANQDIELIADKVVNYSKLIEQAKESIIETKKKVIATREKELKVQIDEVSKEVLAKEDEIQFKKDEIFEIEQWVFRFKKFKSSLANESLEIISGYTNMYLQKMKANLSIQLEGYKTLKNGDIREKITPIILRNGEIEGSGSFRKYSGGERVRIDFAIILALQNLINNSCNNGGMNLLWVDEITEGIDGMGLEYLIDSVKDLGKFIHVTSHVTHEKVNNNIITIEKVNKISKII